MSTSTGAPSKVEPETMSVRELKEELKVGGFNSSGFLEKAEFVEAVKDLRMEASAAAATAAAKSMRKETSASAEATCSQCGKKGLGFKKCSRCMQASYCGAECQKAAWKGHKKKTCVPPNTGRSELSLGEVREKLGQAASVEDHRGVLALEGRMDELLASAAGDNAFAAGMLVNPKP